MNLAGRCLRPWISGGVSFGCVDEAITADVVKGCVALTRCCVLPRRRALAGQPRIVAMAAAVAVESYAAFN